MKEQHNNSQRDYFHSADQPTIMPAESPYVMRHLEMLISNGDLTEGAKILEVGAGVGRFSRLLQSRGFELTASDISPDLIAAFEQQSPDIPAFVSDVNRLPTQHTGQYDAVIGFFMLHHLQDLTASFQSMAAVLKPGGKIIFCEPNAWFFPFYLQILLTPRMRWQVDKRVMNMRCGVLTPSLIECGFTDIQYSGYGFLPPQIYNYSWGMHIDHGLERLPIPAYAKAFQIISANCA